MALTRTDGTSNSEISTSWSYPYNLRDSQIKNGSADIKSISDANDVKPSAEFFVFTGVTAMLISLAFAVVYVLLDRQYRNDERLPLIDFVLCIIWTIFWLAGSAAWAKGVSNIRTLTGADAIAKRSGACTSTMPCMEKTGKFNRFSISSNDWNIFLLVSSSSGCLCEYNRFGHFWFSEFYSLGWLHMVCLQRNKILQKSYSTTTTTRSTRSIF